MTEKKKTNPKWKETDKKIVKIVLDLYMNDPLYPILYRFVSEFFNPTNWLDKNTYRHHSVQFDDDGKIVNSEGTADNFNEIFFSMMSFTPEESWIFHTLFDRKIKVVDVEKKYKISNVTIKARLRKHFIFRKIQEWKIGYLWLMLTYERMIWVAMYNFFQSKEGKQRSEIIDILSFLQEKK